MASQSKGLLAELSEQAATGRIAEIYAEIRRFSGVPYVSSLQRYLATLPGVLEWTWDALRPAMASGVIPETGWRLARAARLSPAVPVTVDTLNKWGVDAAGLAAIRNIAENFVRVSPVNLVTGACLACLLNGARPSGSGFPGRWTPPAMLAPMPGNVDPAQLSPAQRGVLMRFAAEVDGKPFVPALYRQLAHWPAVLGWLADELAPRFAAAETASVRAAFRAAARDAAPEIVAHLPAVADIAPLTEDTTRRVLATIDRYAETSPEMTMFGKLILDALPDVHVRLTG
ncbi:MAG: hypothetical protein ABSC06_17645 [Rhodopila sp.]